MCNKDVNKEVNENVIIARWQAGDQDAFDELYHLHAQAIYRLGWAMLQQSQAAEDVVQETFLRAYKARHRFDPTRASFGTWLYQIALNYCRSHLRRKRLLTIPWLRQTDDAPDMPDTRPGPESHTLRGEYRRMLWEAVQGLSEPLKEVVTLHYYMELPAVEIAVMLECPEGTVYSRLHNARRRLAEMLTAQGLTAPEILEAQNAH
ncbi:MAG TPA: RNA polymerase sigma factor [Anaerolineae bacterium]|nr:RNA polymerase sigma factor [Anaerolineae bacterium]MCB0179136.1 RNA polymerase sigma factor [Anaerolineae bacterium]MCB0222664.1 RNA polymerase sigma factor [Anaerolineae bacterium]MCB9109193.1 RNA polymerase sigma factor [Anaerolineales bacterium]HRV91106.1 RNA polymerase sigma factor [Anaerolineae bacterium]